MPTTNPRIAVTLSPANYRILRRLADLQGRSMSRIVGELVAEMAPSLDRVADVVELAAKAQASVRDEIRAAVADAESSIVPHALAVADRFDAFRDELHALGAKLAPKAKQVGREHGRIAADAPRPAQGLGPRPVTTGATKAQRRAKTASKRSGRVA